MANLFATKSLSVIRQEAAEEGDHTLKRSLGATNLGCATPSLPP